LIRFGVGKIQENMGAILRSVKQVKDVQFAMILPPLSLINVDFEERFGIPRLLLSMLVPCRIASRYSEKNLTFFSL